MQNLVQLPLPPKVEGYGFTPFCLSLPGVGLMVLVPGFGSSGPEFESRSAVELIPGGVNSACHLSEVGKISASMLVYCVGVATHPGLYPIAKETAWAAPTLCTEYGPNGWMDGICASIIQPNNLFYITFQFEAKSEGASLFCGQLLMDLSMENTKTFSSQIPRKYGLLKNSCAWY